MKIHTESGRELRREALASEELLESIGSIIKRHVPDADVRMSMLGPSLYAKVERGWGCDATVQVGFKRDSYITEHGTPAKPDSVTILCLEPCDISWSSTGHHVTSALCAVQVYQEMIAAAAEIDTFWRGAYMLADSHGGAE